MRSLIIGLVLIVFARPLGNFFHLGDSYTVFWAMVPLPILRSIQSPRLVSLYRRFDFHFMTMLNVSEVAASFVFGLIAVLYWRDWRGLVFSLMVGAVVRDVLTYWLFPHWPRIGFSKAHAKTMLSFGLWFSFRHPVRIHCKATRQPHGGPSARSRRARQLPDGVSRGRDAGRGIHDLSVVVTFPMVARLRNDRHARVRLYWSVVGVVAAVGLAYAGFIFVFGDWVVHRLFGPAWIHAVNPLKVLCIYGILQGVLVVGRSFLTGLGKAGALRDRGGNAGNSAGYRDLSVDGNSRAYWRCGGRRDVDSDRAANHGLPAAAD